MFYTGAEGAAWPTRPTGAPVELEPLTGPAARPALARPALLMLDRVTGWWPEGGRAGLGRLRAEKDDPAERFFTAHFFSRTRCSQAPGAGGDPPAPPGGHGRRVATRIEAPRLRAGRARPGAGLEVPGQVLPSAPAGHGRVGGDGRRDRARGAFARADYCSGRRPAHLRATGLGMRIVLGEADGEADGKAGDEAG